MLFLKENIFLAQLVQTITVIARHVSAARASTVCNRIRVNVALQIENSQEMAGVGGGLNLGQRGGLTLGQGLQLGGSGQQPGEQSWLNVQLL